MWAVGSSPPPLQLVGSLPNYDVGQAYEGRLDILNNIGPCGVEIVWEESFLPAGSAAVVDMDNLQVVVTWPAFTPPEEVKTTIVNGDFQTGTLEGWHDLRGSYRVKKYEDDDTTVGPGPRPRPPGNMAAWMEGFGRGDHILESDRYPVQQGQSIMARSLWDQGPSNKDNNNLFTGLGLYRGGAFVDMVLGDRIHDRTNKTRHWSTVNHTITGGVDEITVRLIAHRRNGRNRPIIVDNVETSGLTYSVGQDSPDAFYYLTLRLWDSAGRVAYWSGVIVSTAMILLTTPPYPIVAVDSFASTGGVSSLGTLGANLDEIVSSGRVVSLSLEVTQADHEYDHAPDDTDSLVSTGSVIALELEATIIYTEYDHDPEDSLDDHLVSTGEVLAIDMEVTTNYVTYDHNPEDSIDDHLVSTGIVTGIEMQ